LNSCLDRVNELIAAGTADLVKKEDLAVLQRLQEEFGAELATLRGRVDALDARTATLEKQQFSTTTKLTGEVIFNIADTQGDSVRENGSRAARGVPGERFRVNGALTSANRDDRTETVFTDRVRLGLVTSFSGKDRLYTRLNAGNTVSFSGLTGTNQTRLSFDGDTGNAVGVDKLNYRFPLGDKLRVQIDAINTEFTADSLITTLSPFESSGLGSVSRFGRYNAFYRSGNPNSTGSAGITVAYKLSDSLRLEAGYVSDPQSNDPGVRNGLFNGSFAALGQVVFTSKNLSASVGYARSYFTRTDNTNLTGSTGSFFAANPFGGGNTSSDALAAQVQFKLNPGLILGGWYSIAFADQLGTSNEATIQTGAIYAAFPDFGKKGNLLGLLAGIPPRVTRSDLALRRDNDSTSLHLEAFYRYRLNDNIAITPGLFVLFNPENNNANSTQYVGTIRTTFTF
jgi:Carbohydrate-selective porin, OprB family